MINATQRLQLLQNIQPKQEPQNARLTAQDLAGSFGQILDEVNQEQIQAEGKINEMVAGKNKDVAGTMIAMEKADISLRLLMAMRNKAVNAYQEVMRMQV